MATNMALPTVVPIVRFHISLNVTDLERSVRFYEILFDRPPAKQRDDYAKFEADFTMPKGIDFSAAHNPSAN
jgi:catechol 2,3-dioxygenase-like lactoylglutathione lyase family enzyme